MVYYVYLSTAKEATVIQVTLSLTPEVKAGLKKIAKLRSPRNPMSMSAVVRELVEEELEHIEAMPCHQDPPEVKR